jgi:hypothetical protein
MQPLPNVRGSSLHFRDRSRCTRKLLSRLLTEGTISRNDRVLAIGATEFERDLFRDFGFPDVTLTGFAGESDVDARNLPFDSDSFEIVFEEAVLHHLDRPHLGAFEMYRVASKSIIICESEENLFTNLLAKLGIAESYEVSAVRDEGGLTGGVNNTQIPNHVYRWYRSELPKVFRSLDPTRPPEYTVERSVQLYGKLGAAGRFLESLTSLLLPGFGNSFAFHLRKHGGPLLPWLTKENGSIRLASSSRSR